MVAAIPAVIAAVGTAYAAHEANKSRQQQGDLSKQELAIQKQTQPWANQFLQQSGQALGPSLSYYTSMLANPREATAQEQNRVNTLYQGQASNVRNMQPRGGYGPGAAENLRSQQRGATESVIQQGRPMAAGALGSLGSNLAGLGFQGYGLGAGILGNVFNQGLAARQQQFEQGSSVGNGLFNAYNSYLLNRATQQPGQATQLPTSGTPSWLNQGTMTPGTQSTNTSLYGGSTTPNSGSSGSSGFYGPH